MRKFPVKFKFVVTLLVNVIYMPSHCFSIVVETTVVIEKLLHIYFRFRTETSPSWVRVRLSRMRRGECAIWWLSGISSAQKPVAFALQQNSPLVDKISNAYVTQKILYGYFTVSSGVWRNFKFMGLHSPIHRTSFLYHLLQSWVHWTWPTYPTPECYK